MQIAAFIISAAVSLAASTVLVIRLERVGERLGLSEALLGLVAALAADGPEITSSITAMAVGHGAVGVGVTLGSNVFNLAALLGLSAVIAGRIEFHRRTIVLEGAVGMWIALVSFAVVRGFIGPALGLVLALSAFVPYVGYSALRPARRIRLRLPDRASRWLARALAEEELELAVAIRPRHGDRRDAAVALAAAVIVIGASVMMEEIATSLGAQAQVAPIVVGGLVLAGVTSLPNGVAAVYLASRGRGTATLSEAFNSNALNVIVGFLLPTAILGLVDTSAGASIVVAFYVLLTAATIGLALRGHGLDRKAGSLIIAGYVLFAVVLATR